MNKTEYQKGYERGQAFLIEVMRKTINQVNKASELSKLQKDLLEIPLTVFEQMHSDTKEDFDLHKELIK